MAMDLYKLIDGIFTTDVKDVKIEGVTDNTKLVKDGFLFVCVKGLKFDGHSVAQEMLDKGAAFVVVDHDLGLENQIIVENTRKIYGELCARWFGNPERQIKAIGVTGTNGKTTSTNLIKRVLVANGYKVGLIGTIQDEVGDEILHTDNTTPPAYELFELLRKMVDAGCQYVVMEVSSFGLVQYRVGPMRFAVSVFTNLTQDHLDYHITMENYYQAKKMLFDASDVAIINIDDDYGKRLMDEANCKRYSYSLKQKAGYYANAIESKPNGTTFSFCLENESHLINMKMMGMFNVSNVVSVIGVCLNLGMSIEDILPCICRYPGVRGRYELIPTDRDFAIISDYAHTPDAIEKILSSVKTHTEGKLICIFGAGGARDVKKRPLMAKAAAKYADYVIVSSDNPRDEDPELIIDDVVVGFEGMDIKWYREADREKAIVHAIDIAETGDIIVLAGKGHEDYQVVANDVYVHCDEREIVARLLDVDMDD